MQAGHVPPTPELVAHDMREKLVGPGYVPKKSDEVVALFYKLMKGITHRTIKDVHGKDYEKYYKIAHQFVHDMKQYVKA